MYIFDKVATEMLPTIRLQRNWIMGIQLSGRAFECRKTGAYHEYTLKQSTASFKAEYICMLGDVLSKIGDAKEVKIDLANASATSG